MERRLSRYAQIIPMAGLLFFGCGEDRTAPVGESAEKIIGPAGGTLSLSGGQVILQVPLGALDTATAMTLSTEQGAALPSGAVGGMVVKITPQTSR